MGYDITLGLISTEAIDKLLACALSDNPQITDYPDEKLNEFVTDRIREMKPHVSVLNERRAFSYEALVPMGLALQSTDYSWYMRDRSYSGIFKEETIISHITSTGRGLHEYLSSWSEVTSGIVKDGERTKFPIGDYSVGTLISPAQLQAFLTVYNADLTFRHLVNTYMQYNVYALLHAILYALG